MDKGGHTRNTPSDEPTDALSQLARQLAEAISAREPRLRRLHLAVEPRSRQGGPTPPLARHRPLRTEAIALLVDGSRCPACETLTLNLAAKGLVHLRAAGLERASIWVSALLGGWAAAGVQGAITAGTIPLIGSSRPEDPRPGVVVTDSVLPGLGEIAAALLRAAPEPGERPLPRARVRGPWSAHEEIDALLWLAQAGLDRTKIETALSLAERSAPRPWSFIAVPGAVLLRETRGGEPVLPTAAARLR